MRDPGNLWGINHLVVPSNGLYWGLAGTQEIRSINLSSMEDRVVVVAPNRSPLSLAPAMSLDNKEIRVNLQLHYRWKGPLL